ncbi:WavE lipopolysaccharide synthesis family protein [Seohaeicola saemankumensis]|uniref:WavE lipopolysaccharide synthesis family protein n=1 Tax=Seohaeicola saemankumensis TaxID=481181 RepID=A0ABW3TDP1_9RHOB
MQGPIAKEDDFTLNTLRLYRRNMPDAELILSTWSDEDANALAKVADLGVTVLKNDKPAFAGMSNMNMQIVSAGAGVRHAVQKGAQWVMKTRTDQRLYEPNLLSFLIGMQQSFPVAVSGKQNHRIIGLGQGSLKFVPYHVTDQSLFGNAQDMLAYWTPPLQGAEVSERWTEARDQIYRKYSIGQLCRETVPECYLASHFLTRMGHQPDWTIQDSWTAYRDRFCFADYGTTDFYWVKSQTWTRAELIKTYAHVSNRQEMSFLEWMLLHSRQLPVESASRYNEILEDVFLGVLRPQN